MDDLTNQVVQGRYRLLRCVGEGSQGRVFLAEDLARGGEQVAVKVVEAMVGGHRDSSADGILRWFRHPNWASVLDGGSMGSDGWFQVIRFINGKNLESLEGPQPEAWIWRFLECGARVLGALHRQGIIHYDITPGNWMVEDREGEPNFVLTDGGLAHEGPVSGLGRGTPRFMAPEVTKDGEHDHRADLYSLGLVAFRLATGRDPFEGRAGEVLGKRRRLPAPRSRTYRPELDSVLDAVIDTLLARTPNERPADGSTLLQLISTHRGTGIATHTDDEVASAAESGPIIDREAELARFNQACLSLVARLPRRSTPFVQRDVPKLRDNVLLLHGESGAGCSRLAEEMHSVSRDALLTTISVSGQTPSNGNLVITTIEEALRQIASKPSHTQGNEHVESPRYATGRRLESLVREIEQYSRVAPLVLVVFDYSNLSKEDQRAVQVLSRFLLSKREAARGTSPIPVVLVVDLGASTPSELTLSDSEDPLQPVVTLSALSRRAVKSLCQSRLPGLAVPSDGWSLVQAKAAGMPGAVLAMLGEGLHRSDLQETAGQWTWNVSELSQYSADGQIGPSDRLMLARCSPSQRRALLVSALLPHGIPLDMLEQRFNDISPNWVEECDLVTKSVLHGRARIGPRTPAIGAEVMHRGTDADRASVLRTAQLETTRADCSLDYLDRAVVHRLAGEHSESVSTLVTAGRKSFAWARAAACRELELGLSHGLDGLRRVAQHAHLETVLGADACSVRIAKRVLTAEVADQLPEASSRQVLSTLLSAREYRDAEAFAARRLGAGRIGARERCQLLLTTARAQLASHAHLRGRHTLTEASRILRTLRDLNSSETTVLRAEYAALLAQCAYLGVRFWSARRLLRIGLSLAKSARARALSSDLYNGLGVAEQALGSYHASGQHFERAIRLRRALGDVEGTIQSSYNLGRLLFIRGELASCAAGLQAAGAMAQRHGRAPDLSQILRTLANVYDQQMNARLALTTLQRAMREAQQNHSLVRAAFAAWDAAPMAAAAGDMRLCRQALILSARHARASGDPRHRATHALVRATAAMHTGRPARARTHCKRAKRYSSALFPLGQMSLAATTSLVGGHAHLPENRPTRGTDARDHYRVLVWSLMARRSDRAGVRCARASIILPAPNRRPGFSGPARRLVAEVLMRLAQRPMDFAEAKLGAMNEVRNMERHLSHSGARLLRSRALAVASKDESLDAREQARALSNAVHALSRSNRTAKDVPAEFDTATPMPTDAVARLHAVAHQALISSNALTIADDRVTTALRNVLDATAALNASGDAHQLLQTVTERALDITGAERTCIVQVRDGRPEIRTVAMRDSSGAGCPPISAAVIERATLSSEPLLLHDVFDDEELMQRPSITRLSLRSIMCVPIARGDQYYGVMYADHASAAAAFDQTDLEILSLFSEQVAATLQTKQLFDDLQGSLEQLRTTQNRLVQGERLRVLGEVSTGVAHEFNNLLTGILARVQLARLGPLPEAIANDLSLIEKASLDAAEIVRRLQNFSRSERQRGFGALDLAEIATDAVEFLRPIWSQRQGDQQTVVRVLAENDVRVRGNATELREVVTNLLKNAMDASTKGGTIRVIVRQVGGRACIEVADAGEGIPDSLKLRILDPFFTTKGDRGTGLGLPLCLQIVERHGGELGIQSDLGVGTTVTVQLPSTAMRISAPKQQSPGLDKSLKILVIDDDDNVRTPLRDYLTQAGHDVEIAASGAQGLDVMARFRPDVVLADIHMPNLDGIEFCSHARERSPTTPVVLMSGRSDEYLPQQIVAAGAHTLLAKPFAMRTVQDLLSRVVNQPEG